MLWSIYVRIHIDLFLRGGGAVYTGESLYMFF